MARAPRGLLRQAPRMCYSYMHTPAMHIMPRYAMRHVHSGCTRAAALLARARGRHHELARLSRGWAAEEWAALDSCGNSVAHVAALRGAARCLRLAYGTGLVAASTRNAAGWTALQEAHPTHCGCRTRASLSPSCVAVLIPTPTPALIAPDPSPAGGHRCGGRAHGAAHLRPDGPGRQGRAGRRGRPGRQGRQGQQGRQGRQGRRAIGRGRAGLGQGARLPAAHPVALRRARADRVGGEEVLPIGQL